jgi:hypothetical protein
VIRDHWLCCFVQNHVDTGGVTIDWSSYERYDPGLLAPLRALPRAEARKAYERRMQARPARMEMLRRLVKANGVELDGGDPAVQDLNDWFYAHVEPDPDNPGRLLPAWYSVVNDIALFLGDVMIERHPNLRWEFFTWGRKSVCYHQHVIMGFSTEDPKFKTSIDLERRVATYGHRIVAQRGSVRAYGIVTVRGVPIDVDAIAAQHRGREIETDAFWRWLQDVASRA